MPKLSPREAVKVYQVSRATLTKALQNGKISAGKTEAGHWQIDPAELARLYWPRASKKAVNQPKPDQKNHDEPDQKTALGHDLAVRLAMAEAELSAERVKVDLLQLHLDDVRRMLQPPDATPRRRWWQW